MDKKASTMNQLLNPAMKNLEEQIASMKFDGKCRKELTFHVARHLSMQGINPTVEKVRNVTGQGSTSDIARDLKEYRDELAKSLRHRSLKVSLPDEYLGLVETMIEQIWEGATDISEKQFDKQRAEIEAKLSTAARLVETTKTLHQAEIANSQALKQELATERQKREEVEQKIAGLMAERDQLAQSVTQWQANTEAERQTRETEREQASREMDAMRQAHQRSMEQAEGDRKYVMLQLDMAREAERGLRAQLLQAENDRIHTNERQRIEVNNLRDKNGALSLQIGELRGELKATTASNEEYKTKIETLYSKLDELNKSRAEEAERDMQASAVEKILIEARNAPNVFEVTDNKGYEVKAEFNPDKKKPDVWLEDENGKVIGQRFQSVAPLDKYCLSLNE